MCFKIKLTVMTFFAFMSTISASADSFIVSSASIASISDISFGLSDIRNQGKIFFDQAKPRSDGAIKSVTFSADHDSTAKLKHLIGSVEAGKMGYDAVQYGARIKPGKPPTKMTIAEIYRWIDSTPNQQHAIGRYQFIPATLKMLVARSSVSKDTRFTRGVQDTLADILLADAGYEKFLNGSMSRHKFMNNLTKIWAGLPGSNGKSHYEGIAGNRSIISWNQFSNYIKEIFPLS